MHYRKRKDGIHAGYITQKGGKTSPLWLSADHSDLTWGQKGFRRKAIRWSRYMWRTKWANKMLSSVHCILIDQDRVTNHNISLNTN